MKKIFILAGILNFFLACTCFAQEIIVTEGIIKSFTGKIINEKADLNLLIIRDSVVKGTYSFTKNAIPVNVSGKMKQKQNIHLNELSDVVERKGIFTGKLTDSVFQGKYTDVKNKKSGKFYFTHVIPKGSMPFNAYSLTSSKKLYNIESSPKCDLNFSFLFPKSYSNKEVLDSVQNIIKQTYFFKTDGSESVGIATFEGINPEQLLLSQANYLFSDYTNAFPDSIDPNFFYGSQDWDYYTDMAVVCNQDELLTLEFSVYQYTGGAHGIYGNVYKNIDLRSGKSIWLNDIFIENYENVLSKKITEQVKINYQIGADASLASVGFWDDTLTANSNFYLTTSGIGFFYNPYEIAPYALGTTDVFIPFIEIECILKKESLFFYKN